MAFSRPLAAPMTHLYQKHREQHAGRARAKHILKADGGGIDESVDISTPGPTQYPYGLGQKMNDIRSAMDHKEAAEGTRFEDWGSRIPGSMKAKNDAWRDKMKGK